jgi:ATP-dependent protease ClpP protease subunit
MQQNQTNMKVNYLGLYNHNRISNSIKSPHLSVSYKCRLKPIYKKKRFDFLYQHNKKIMLQKKVNNETEIQDEPIIDLEKLSSSEDKKKIDRELNHIYFYSEVNRESIYELISLIREAQEECCLTQLKMNIEDVPIYLHISSYGGSIFDAFTAIDIIKSSKFPIYTIIDGASASAGTLISVVGKKRFIRPNSYMLIHQLSSGCWGKYSEIQDEFKNLKDLSKKIKAIYTEHTNIPQAQLKRILKHDLWLDADKCLGFNMVDELWTQ